LPNSSRQLNLTRQTNALARPHIHPVNGPPAKINEITTQGSERIEEIGLSQIGKSSKKGILNGSVETRIRLIEKSSRSRWCFAYEKDSHAIRSIAFSQTLSR